MVQRRHPRHRSSTPISTGPSRLRGMSVATADRRKLEPYSFEIIEPCLPNWPRPARTAMGICSASVLRGSP